MKSKEIIALVSVILGVGAGFGAYWVTPEAHWGFYVAIGIIVFVAGANGLKDGSTRNQNFENLGKKLT